VEALLAEFDLVPFRNRKTGVLSSGEQTRVSLAKAMLNRPRLLLLDEPTASLDPSVAREERGQDLAGSRVHSRVPGAVRSPQEGRLSQGRSVTGSGR